MKSILTFFLLTFFFSSLAQSKSLEVKPVIDQKTQELVVEKWVTTKPEIKGKFILIDFWATWCAPCRKLIPKLNDFHNEFVEDLVVIGLSSESKSKVRRMKYPIIEYFSAIDRSKRLMKKIKVERIPYCILVNPDGIVVWEGHPNSELFKLTNNFISRMIDNYKIKK